MLLLSALSEHKERNGFNANTIPCRERIRQIVIVALNTEMRLGEILNLQWYQFDLKDEVIIVEHMKNGKTRKIPINSQLREVLESVKIKGRLLIR